MLTVRTIFSFALVSLILSPIFLITTNSQGDPYLLDHGNGLRESVWDFQNPANYTLANATIDNESVILDTNTHWWNQTSQADFENATQMTNINTSSVPGQIGLDDTSGAGIQTIVIQPGPLDTKDSFIMSGGGQNMNYGTSNQLRLVGGAPNIIKRAFIQFNLSSIPADSRISQASLQLYFNQSMSGNPTNVSVHRTTHWWSEMGITYNDYDGIHPWATAGGDFDPLSYDVRTLLDGDYGWKSWDVTSLLISWLNGTYANHGFLLKQVNDSADSGIDPMFHSSDDIVEPGKWPRLIVNFSSVSLIKNGAFSTDSNWIYDSSANISVGWNSLEQNIRFEHTADSHPPTYAEVIPSSGGGTGGDGDPVDELKSDDGVRFRVGFSEDIIVDGFDVGGLVGSIRNVVLNVQYRVEAIDYQGMNAIGYADCLGFKRVTSIQPHPSENTDINRSEDITDACRPWTLVDISKLYVFFVNDDAENKRFVEFDRIWLTLEVEHFNESAYLNQTITKQMRTGFTDTSEEDFKQGNGTDVDMNFLPGSIVLNGTTETRTIPFQPGPLLTKDSSLVKNAPDMNYGAQPSLDLVYDPIAGVESRGIIEFNISTIPYATLNFALLRLYFYDDTGTGSLGVSVYRVLGSWEEATVTWNERMLGQAWRRSGGDIHMYPYDTVTLTSGNYGWAEWNITELVRGWVDGEFPNYGIILRAVGGETGQTYRLASSEYLTISEWPEIVVNITGRAYKNTGTYVSPVIIFNPDKSQTFIHWTASTVPGITSVRVQTRTGRDPDPLLNPDLWNPWSSTVSAVNSTGQMIAPFPAPYIQYRVILNTTMQGRSPIFHDITIYWRQVNLTFERLLDGMDGLTETELSVGIDAFGIWKETNLGSMGWVTDRVNTSRYVVGADIYDLGIQLRLDTNTIKSSKMMLFIDNVTTSRIVQGEANGIYYSQIFDTGTFVNWGNISWNCSNPPGTVVAIGTRTGPNPIIDPSWSTWTNYSNPVGEPVGNPSNQYIQYKIYLATKNAANNPSVSDVNISYWRYSSVGEVETSDLMAINVTAWDVFDSNSTTGPETSIEYFQSTDSGGSWNNVAPGQNLSLSPIPKIRFKAILRTDNGTGAPMLHQMSLLFWVSTAGPLDHIHMSPGTWSGTADEWVDLDAIGHDVNHNVVSFIENWSTTDPTGSVGAAGLYQPGSVGTWRVYCNNTDNTISNYTTVSVLPGNISRIEVNPWQPGVITTDGQILFDATGFDSDGNLVGPAVVNWSLNGAIGFLDPGPSSTSLFTATTPGVGNVTADDGKGHTNTTQDVTVNVGSVFRVGINPWNPGSVTTDDSVLFSAEYFDSDGNLIGPANVMWSVNGGIGNMPPGPSTTSVFDPTTVGIGNISCDDLLGHTNNTVDFLVTAGGLDHIIVSPGVANLFTNEEMLFRADGFDNDGNPVQKISSNWTTNAGTILSYNETEANLRASDTTLSNGWINITATSQGNVTGSAIVNVVAIPQNPVIAGTVPDQEREEDHGSWALDLSAYASDPQDNLTELSWYFTGVDENIVTITGQNIQGNHLITLTTVNNAFGAIGATIWLKDGDGNLDFQPLWINITPVNDRPFIDRIIPFSLHYDVPYPYHFDDYVYDVETVKDNLVLICSDQEHTTVNGLLIIFAYPQEFLGQTVYPLVTVRDEEGAESSTIVAITITDDNVPILETELPDVTLYEDEYLDDYFDLDDYFSDPDGDSLYFTHGNTHVNISIDEPEHTVDFWAESDWNGVEIVTFSAIDPHNARAEDRIVVTVLPVNDGPIISGVPDQVVHYDDSSYPSYNYTFDLLPYITDIDNPPEELVVSTNYPTYIKFYQPLNLVMVIHFPESMKGMTLQVLISVSDGLESDSQTIGVTISDDWPPQLVAIPPDVAFPEDETADNQFNITTFFTDRDGDFLVYSYGNVNVYVTIDNVTGMVSFSAATNWFGVERVTFRATDPTGGLAECWITVTVIPVNDAPIIRPIPKQIINETQSWTLDLRLYVYDVDNNFTDLEFALNSNYPFHVYHAGGLIVFEYDKGTRYDTVSLTVSDGELNAITSFDVEIIPEEPTFEFDIVLWFWVPLIIVLAALAGYIVIRKLLMKMKVESVFIIYRSGKLIDQVSRQDSLKVDEDIFSAMLTAVKEYADESLTSSGKDRLRTLETGRKKLMIERGDLIFLAVVFTGTESKRNEESLTEVLKRIEEKYEDDLDGWSGTLEPFGELWVETTSLFDTDKENLASSIHSDRE